ncbi:MAG: SseB family protein [Aeromicrobium erythreum]
MSHDRTLAEPAFPDDDGSADPALATALGDDLQVLAVLGGVRVLVPVVATLGEGGRTAAGADKDADMAAVLMRGADGRQALLTFSSLDTLHAWDPHARPVPVLGRDAARAAIDEGASALLLDLGSPGFGVVETEDLEHLAAGHRLVRTAAGSAWVTG